MNVHHLELFYYVAKFQGITEAVRRMPYGIQQPAVSGQILQLEKQLGVKLFHRRPFTLTPSGEELYGYVYPFFSKMEQMKAHLQGNETLHLRLAITSSVMGQHLLELLEKLRIEYPDLRLTMIEHQNEELEHVLRRQEADIAITPLHGSKPVPGIKSRSLVQIPLVLVTSSQAPARQFHEIIASGYGNRITLPLLCLPKRSPVAQVFQEGLKAYSAIWEPTMEVIDHTVLLRYVASGFGYGVSVDLPDAVWPEGIKIVPLPDDFLRLHLGVLHAGDLKPVAGRFIELATESARRLRSNLRNPEPYTEPGI